MMREIKERTWQTYFRYSLCPTVYLPCLLPGFLASFQASAIILIDRSEIRKILTDTATCDALDAVCQPAKTMHLSEPQTCDVHGCLSAFKKTTCKIANYAAACFLPCIFPFQECASIELVCSQLKYAAMCMWRRSRKECKFLIEL